MVNSKYFPLGFPRSVRSVAVSYSGPTVNSPSPSEPGFSEYDSAALPAKGRLTRVTRVRNRFNDIRGALIMRTCYANPVGRSITALAARVLGGGNSSFRSDCG